MDKQLLFDDAVTALIKQGALSKVDFPDDDLPTCVYFDPTTQNRCLVGLLVSKPQAKKLEARNGGNNAGAAIEMFPTLLSKYGVLSSYDSHKRYVNALQDLHDGTEVFDDFLPRAKQFAEDYDLNTKVLTNA